MEVTLNYKGGTLSLKSGVWTCTPKALSSEIDVQDDTMVIVSKLIAKGATVQDFKRDPNFVDGRIY